MVVNHVVHDPKNQEARLELSLPAECGKKGINVSSCTGWSRAAVGFGQSAQTGAGQQARFWAASTNSVRVWVNQSFTSCIFTSITIVFILFSCIALINHVCISCKGTNVIRSIWKVVLELLSVIAVKGILILFHTDVVLYV
jgi:hypothetical protein